MTGSNEAAKAALEPLFHPSVRPNYDWNHAAISAGFVQHGLAQLHSAFFVHDAFGIPLSKKPYTRIAPADRVDDGDFFVHTPRFYPRSRKFKAVDSNARISLIDSFRQSGKRGVILAITSRMNACLLASGTVANVVPDGKFN
jgi:hypothetical protein